MAVTLGQERRVPDKQAGKNSADEISILRERAEKLENELGRARLELDSLSRQLKLSNAVLDNITSVATVKDSRGCYLLVNKAARQVIGKSAEQIIGGTPFDFYPREIAEKIHRDDMEVLRSGETLTTEETLSLDDGKHYYTTKVPLPGDDGKPEGLVGLAVDITGLKQARDALRESEALLNALFSNSVVAIVLIDSAGKIIRINRQAINLLGYEDESEVLGMTAMDVTHPDFVQAHLELRGKLVKGEIDFYKTEKQYLRKDGSSFWGEVYVYPIQAAPEGEKLFVGLVVDITQRKTTSLALQHRADLERLLGRISSGFLKLGVNEIERGIDMTLRDIGEFTGVDRSCVYRFSHDGLRINTTHEWCRQGITSHQDELKGLPVEQISWTMKNISERGTTVINDVDELPPEAETEKKVCLREGIKSLVIVPLVSGVQVIGLAGFDSVRTRRKWSADDVTLLQLVGDTIANAMERKRVIKALRESEERFREMAEMLPQSILEIDLNGVVTYHNRNAVTQLEYSPEDFKRDFNVLDLFVPEQHDAVRDYMFRLLQGEYFGLMQFTFRRKDGSTFPALINAVPLWEDGVPVGARSVVVDISERQQLEEERRRTTNLESVGLLAGGIAHDFNNILASIMGYINMAQIAEGGGKDFKEYLVSAERAAMRAKGLTQQLLTFSKGGKPVKSIVSVARLIINSANLSLIGSNVKCDFAIDDALWPAEIDEGQIGQVLNNIIINAKQAMPGGGVIKIGARNLILDEGKRMVPLKKGDYLQISIADSGGGIPKEHIDKIFEPYFTTKANGSGLGLATSYSIVVKHDGYIDVESLKERGAKFFIYLPASPGRQPGEDEGGSSDVYVSGRILLMDDEPELLKVMATVLEFYGSTVEVSVDGDEALKKYKAALEQGRPFDLVVMDLTIPGGMGGRETIAGLLKLDPDARVIVSSGYSDNAVLARYESYGFSGAISKPYSHKQLMETVSKVLSA